MSNIAFVIPIFNRLAYTQECLKILGQNSKSPFFTKNTIEIVIADDGSKDGSRQWVEANYPHVKVLQGTGDLWYSGSMNLGIKYALGEYKSDYIVIWENDIFPGTGFFDHLQNILEKSTQPDIICSKIYFRNPADRVFAMGGYFDTRTGRKEIVGYMKPDGPEFSKVLSVDWFCGQGVVVPRPVFEKIGYLDEINFPQYHGDSDFALRAKKAGFRIMVYPELKVWNDTDTSGLAHIKDKTFATFIESLHSIRSNMNFSKDLKFYRRHTTSILAYKTFFIRYASYFGSFFKWKLLGLFGIKKEN